MEKKKELQTNQQPTSIALWKDSNVVIVDLLKTGKLDEVSKSVPNKVSEILDREPIASLVVNAGKENVQMYVESEIIKLAANVNVNNSLNIKDYQVSVIAEHLIENYKWESIEDFTLCFRRGSAGLYGEIFRLDGAVIGNWMAKYLDEKYDALEQRKNKEKKETDAVDFFKLTQEGQKKFGKDSEYYKEAEKMAKKLISKVYDPNDNSRENEFQKFKMAYNPVGLDELKRRELHTQYIRENYDAISGKPKSTWISESEWLNRLP